jgi:hypothetical protein
MFTPAKVRRLSALNLTPSFWVTARVAMEYQSILTVGKIFGPRKPNPNNIDSLSDHSDEWLADYMKGVHVPTPRDLNPFLRRLSRVQRARPRRICHCARPTETAGHMWHRKRVRWPWFHRRRRASGERITHE